MDKAKIIEPLVGPGRTNSDLNEFEAGRLTNFMLTTGEARRIANHIPERLEELGWNSRILEECRNWLKANTASGQRVYYGQKIREKFREPEDVDPAELVEPLKRLAMDILPEDLCVEIKEHIMKVIAENLLGWINLQYWILNAAIDAEIASFLINVGDNDHNNSPIISI